MNSNTASESEHNSKPLSEYHEQAPLKKPSDQALESIANAAANVKNKKEAAAVFTAAGHSPGLTESGIAPDVLDVLLPDKEVVELPRVKKVSGGAVYRVLKRGFDIISSSFALIVLAIPMVFISVKIKTESPGPVVYAQRRIGKNGKLFKVYKFRSMRVDAEINGAQWAKGDDPRVTPFGKKLRKTRLDEIPQFWNVIKGDMSLIGPRPERPAFHEVFCERLDGWDQRLLVKPGISGLAQVTGGYELLPKEKAKFDLYYIEERGFLLDLKIIGKTISTIISGKGSR